MNPGFVGAFLARLDASGLSVSEDVVRRLAEYYDLLAFWNRRINLTALPLAGFPPQTIDRLLIEPLVAATLVAEDVALNTLDLGSGGGSPALPLKIARPSLRLTMVESRERKASFLREAVRRLDLGETDVLGVRFSDVPAAPSHQMDLITIRAVKLDSEIVDIVKRWLSSSGQLFLFGAADVPANWPFREIERLPIRGSVHPLSVWTKDLEPRTKD